MRPQLDQAARERLFAAEHRIAGLRLLVVLSGTIIYPLLLDKTGTRPDLAYAVLAAAWTYGLLVYFVRPYRRYPILLSTVFTCVTDAAVTMVWLYATGGYDSPFYVALYVAVVGVAFRYTAREAAFAACVYAGAYAGLLAGLGQIGGNAGAVTVRLTYVFFAAALGAIVAHENALRTRASVQARQVLDASRILTEEPDLDRTLQRLVDTATRLTRADRGAVYLVERDGGGLYCAASAGLSPEYVQARTAAHAVLPGFAVLQGAPMVQVADARTDPRLEPIRAAVEREGFRTYVVFRLAVKGETIGSLSLYRDAVEPFGADETALARSLANHAAIAIENARLLKESRENETWFRKMFEESSVGTVLIGLDGRVVDANRAFCQAFGYTKAQAARLSVAQLTHPDDLEETKRHVEGLMSGAEPSFEFEKRCLASSGDVIWVHTRATLLRDAEGAPVHMLAHVEDISSRRTTQEALRESEAKWRTVVENAPETILLVDASHRITFINRGPPGSPPETLLGASVYDAVLPEDRSLLRQAYDHVFADGTPAQFEVRGPSPDGAPATYRGSIGPVKRDGRVVAAIAVTSDVTQMRKAESERVRGIERLKELERLRELNDFKTRFINTAAHELSTPLTPIKLQLHMLRTRNAGALPPELRRSLDVVDRNLERLSTLVTDMLEAARLQAGRLGVDKRPTDVARVVADAVESFDALARRTGVRLEAKLTAGLRADADPHRLTQVMFNLLSNALKFTPAGGTVTVLTRPHDSGVLITVRDTGVGLTKDQMGRLFQPFTQVHGSSEAGRPGTGLGLYISRGIVELHGGRITCQSPGLGHGSQFSVLLPAAADTGAPPRARELERSRTAVVRRGTS